MSPPSLFWRRAKLRVATCFRCVFVKKTVRSRVGSSAEWLRNSCGANPSSSSAGEDGCNLALRGDQLGASRKLANACSLRHSSTADLRYFTERHPGWDTRCDLALTYRG